MEIHGTFIFLLVLVIFLSYQLPSSAYTLPDKYFINCGSSLDINVTSRTFVGDLNFGSFSFTELNSSVSDSKQSSETPSLYQTARIFRQKSSYEFEINTNGTHLVRLHFFNSSNLSAAVFDVSASGFLLLHNFTVNNSSSSIIVKEFIFSIPVGKFLINFSPQGSSFAFINAIEVFLAPPDFIYDEPLHISQTGNSSSYENGLLSRTLHTVHRINVGGKTLTPENDTLGRTWLPDDIYLFNSETAKNSQLYSSSPNYEDPVNEFIAPDMVYKTAKEMNIDYNRPSNNFNVTWSFSVTRDTGHMIRVHFCDIVRSSPLLRFFLYINSNFRQKIIPHERVEQLDTPFFNDFVVDSDDSGFINISIGPDSSSDEKAAFLNGVEIMEIVGESDFVSITTESTQKTLFIIIGSVLGGLAVVFILVGVLFVVFKLRKPKPKAVETSEWPPLTAYKGSTHSNRKTRQLSTRTSEGTVNASPVPNLNLGLKIPFVEIQLATNYFDEKLLVGKGGFGNVYRGILRNGINVAVKRSHPGSHQGLPEFQTEIMVLSRIQHHHLVSMIGYCDEGFEMILVYEFMEKGTLRDHLYNSKQPCLTWKQRLEICIGAARGLQYLHTGASGRIIHRDVKSTNILLDENLEAKVADFGLSRTTGLPDQTHVSTNVKGTFGYLDPEYFRTQQLTDKSDVYSFGVVLLEVLCARPAIDPSLPREQVNLADWGMLCKKKGLLEQIVDPYIKPQINPNSLRKFSEIAEKCLEEDARDRPTMGDVAWDLEYSLRLQQTAVIREPHEDSTSSASGLLPLRILQHIPSIPADQIDSGNMPSINEDYSDLVASANYSDSVPSANEVFSQLRINYAR